MSLQQTLKQLGFKRLAMPGLACYQLDGLYAEVHRNNPLWEYGWITGNSRMDNRRFPGGITFEGKDFLIKYVEDYRKAEQK